MAIDDKCYDSDSRLKPDKNIKPDYVCKKSNNLIDYVVEKYQLFKYKIDHELGWCPFP